MDVVLAFDGDPRSGLRVLTGGKNRFGTEGEVAWFEMSGTGLAEADPALLVAEAVTIAVQVMGKLRGTIEVPPNSPEAEVLRAAEAEINVARALEGKRVVKRIHVPNRIVNFVIAG